MDELEEMFRESFERHADEVDTSLHLRPRRGRRWVAPLAAAAVVAAVATGVAVFRDDAPEVGPAFPAPTQPAPAEPAGWRVEQWRGVQVAVPPDWGWGGAPLADDLGDRGGDALVTCGASAFVDSSGRKITNGEREGPYVGRPVYMTDLCMGFDPAQQQTPTAPYVWLGAPLDLGTRHLGGGWIQETTQVAGETVTVTSDDDRLRSQILASARPAAGECAATLPQDPRPVGDLPDIELPTSMAVCAYEGSDDSGWQLVYSTTADPESTAAFVHALPDNALEGAGEPGTSELVVLHVSGAQLVVRLSSFSTIELRGVYALSVETVRPWAIDGIPAYVFGPRDYSPELAPYFKGMLG